MAMVSFVLTYPKHALPFLQQKQAKWNSVDNKHKKLTKELINLFCMLHEVNST